MKKYLLIALSLVFQYSQAQTPIDRTTVPPAGPAPVLTIKDPTIYKLPNGMTLLVVEDHRFPKVSATFSIDRGPVTEGAKAGVMNLMGGMLNEGTQKMSKADFDQAVDKLGANVYLNANGGSASALTRYFQHTFSLMGQALREPAFKQESFDKLKTQALTNFKSEANSVQAVSSRVVKALSYGKTHPEGEFETEESIQGVNLNDIKAAYHENISPSRSYLTIVGDIKPEQAKLFVNEVFGTWKGVKLTLPVLADVNNPDKTEIDLVNMSNAVQSEISVVNLITLKQNNPDYFPALLANYILGGGAQSRLFMNLREKYGFTYGAYSSLGSGRFQSRFDASASVRNAKVDSAVTQFLAEIKRIRTEKVSDEELKVAKALYNGSFALGLEDPARTAKFASNILINELPADFYKTYLQRVNAVTPEDILRVSQKYMNYQNTRIVVVGNLSQIPDSLKKSGYLVKYFDTYASAIAVGADKSKPAISATDVIKKYLAAIGGIDKLKEIKTEESTSNMTVSGMSLTVIQKKMIPNLENTTMSMGGNTMLKTVFDGNKGYQEQMGNKKEFTPEEIAQKKSRTSLFEQLDYLQNPAFKLAVVGLQKIGGSDAYQLSIIDPTGKKSSEYYDVKSGLLVKSETTVTTGANTVNTSVEVGDYRKAGVYLIPYKQTISITSTAGSQTIEMTVKEAQLNPVLTSADFKP